MGRVEKGLQRLRGRPLIEWVIERFRPQVDELSISANQELEAYASYGLPVLPDVHRESGGDIAGPLAGLHAGMQACRHGLIATVPCDVPLLPPDLVGRLRAALLDNSVDVAIPKLGEQVQPVFVLARTAVLPVLDAYIASGQRRADGWYAGLRSIAVNFDDEAAAFLNINTLAELQDMEGSKGPR
jgi:molybdopterin-guanine dinucleotide biosynthesis protein A